MLKKAPNNHNSGIREKKGKNWYKNILSNIAMYSYLFYIL